MDSVDAVPQCGSGNDYDGRIGLRVSSIFVIGFGSMLGNSPRLLMCSPLPYTSTNIIKGALFPIFAARTKSMHVPKAAFFVAKYFGSGVIIATAFIHVSPLPSLLPTISILTLPSSSHLPMMLSPTPVSPAPSPSTPGSKESC